MKRLSKKLLAICVLILFGSVDFTTCKLNYPDLTFPSDDLSRSDYYSEVSQTHTLSLQGYLPVTSAVRVSETAAGTASTISSPVRKAAAAVRDQESGPQATSLVESASLGRRRRISQAQVSNVACPLDYSWMGKFPWFAQTCQNNFTLDNTTNCCNALLYAIAQAESEHLKLTGQFRLKDVATVGACVMALSTQLETEGVNNVDIIPTCFPQIGYPRFVTNHSQCQGIQTKSDYERSVGPALVASMHSECSASLLDTQVCQNCVEAMESGIYKLTTESQNNTSPNSTDCTIFTVLYAGGISNSDGPFSAGTAKCLFGVDVSVTVRKSSFKNVARDIAIGSSAALAASLLAFAIFDVWRRRRRDAVHREFVHRNQRKVRSRPNTGLMEFTYEQIKTATGNFSINNYLGSGGFGDVYRGVMEDGLLVAVKRMKSLNPHEDDEFVNEVTIINSVRHKNVVVLRGCCVASTAAEGHQRILVYDYLPNGSLYDYLFGKDKPVLTWEDRRRLAIDMARGIDYLHNATRPPIIHRDIKSANILLDHKLNARVADFGLAKFTVEGQSHMSTDAAGTMGYIAPESVMYNQISEKSDVYSFGVVLLELISGKKALECRSNHAPNLGYSLLTDWARAVAKEGDLLDIVDERIRDVGPSNAMQSLVHLGMLCCHELVLFRPSMVEAVNFLEGGISIPEFPNAPLASTKHIYERDPFRDGLSFYDFTGTSSGTSSTANISVSDFTGRSADVSPRELLR